MTLLDEIRKGEGERMEFKVELPEESMRYVDTVISYSNGAGGKLIIGVDDQRNIKGLSWEEMNDVESRVTSAVSDLCTPQIVPHFHRWNLDGKNVIEIRIHEGDKRPYHIKGKKWETTTIRVGSANRQASEATIREMELHTSGKTFDGSRSDGGDLDESEIKKLCEDLTEYKKREFTRKDLVNLRVIKKDADGEYPTLAYALLVGSNHPSYVTECASFKDTTKLIFLDKETIDGPVYKQIDKAVSFVLRHINVGIRLRKGSIANEDIFEMPEAAIRESIANALAHRNYMQIEGRTMVAVFSDRIEVTSQGTLPSGLTLEDALAGGTMSRNPILTNVFRTAGVTEGWGSGMENMVKLCRSYGLKDPLFEKMGAMFRVTFYRPKEFDPTVGHGEAKKYSPKTNMISDMSVMDGSVYDAIKNGKGESIGSLIEETGLSRASVTRSLESLKDKGLVVRIGTVRKGHYEIKQSETN